MFNASSAPSTDSAHSPGRIDLSATQLRRWAQNHRGPSPQVGCFSFRARSAHRQFVEQQSAYLSKGPCGCCTPKSGILPTSQKREQRSVPKSHCNLLRFAQWRQTGERDGLWRSTTHFVKRHMTAEITTPQSKFICVRSGAPPLDAAREDRARSKGQEQ